MGKDVTKSAVFQNGQFIGWRVNVSSGSKLDGKVPNLSLVTHICGVPANEIVESGAACCKTSPSDDIEVTISTREGDRNVRVLRSR
jgi:hypothetical protein